MSDASRETAVSPCDTSSSTSTESPYFMMSGACSDLQYDQHSSEEELEVINSAPKDAFRKSGGGGGGDSTATVCNSNSNSNAVAAAAVVNFVAPPEKRKWSACAGAVDADGLASPFTARLSVASDENDENAAYNSRTSAALSSDGEEREPNNSLPAPVRFRTSPPLEALKPRRGHRGLPPLAALGGRACSCCADLFHYDVSPRKRSRHSSRRHMQRPCLDFDKMQQLKVHAVTAWRHGGAEHGGELSVFCW